MAKAWLITHPETDLDKQGKVHGRLDPPLSSAGHLKAYVIARQFKGKRIGTVYSSPRIRARQLAMMIGHYSGANVKVNDGLIPWDLANLSGVKVAAMRPLLEYYSSHPDKPVPGGESKSAVLDRYKRFIRTIKAGDIIVGHSQHSLALEHVRKGGNAAKVPMFGGKAGEVKEIEV